MSAFLPGRTLYLAEDLALVRSQLSGVDSRTTPALADDVSTDEMCPAWACYFFDERLAQYCLVGFRGQAIEPGSVARGGFRVLVGGERFGCGSSRETAPFAQRAAGIRLVIAKSFSKIYRQNCHNLGLFTSTDFSLLERLARGEALDEAELVSELDALSRAVVLAGGLGPYAADRRRGDRSFPVISHPKRPLTLAEKIITRHASLTGDSAVAPGDALFVRADLRFSHDYTTAMVDAELRAAFGEDSRLHDPSSIYLFRDHLALLEQVMPAAQRRLGLLDQAAELSRLQVDFARRHGLRLFGMTADDAGICHNLVLDRLAKPGEVVVGTDSHTCTAGALGCFAFGVGSTDMAAGFVGGDFRLTVPESVRIELVGALRPGVSAKDAWLWLLSRDDVRRASFVGRVLELGGPGLARLSLDERATLTNMAVEAGAFTAVAELDDELCRTVARARGADEAEFVARRVEPDADATYAARWTLDLEAVELMVALPSDPKNGVPLSSLERDLGGPVRIDVAYGGSCSGSKRADLDSYAAVLALALDHGLSVAPGVELYIQFGSSDVRRYAEQRGYVDILQRAGASLLEPGCGACIGAGPGASMRPETVTVSAANRNFPGRSGPGRVYLASPAVVAASAVLGRIAGPDAFGA